MSYRIRQLIGKPKNNGLRRTADVAVSLTGLILMSPLFVLLPCILFLCSGTPIYYGQTRVGRDGDLFRIWKFRTMKRKAEPFGPELSHPDDPRVTAFGRLLRKVHLDEIPQLWNVLRGDMTIIGYRPERPFYVTKILKEYPEYQELLISKPGLVSYGVIEYGYASTIDSLIERAKMDTDYLSNRTRRSDFNLLIRTLDNILTGKGV